MKIRTSIDNLENYKIFLKVEEAVCEFLKQRGYLKVDLPVLSPALVPESYLEVFKTQFNFLNKKKNLYLIPTPELFQKRLLAYGSINNYYLGKCFRNSEPSSQLHSFEFTMLELYKMEATYWDIADEVLKMLKFVAKKLNNKEEIIYQGQKISFSRWEKISVGQAFKTFAAVGENELFDKEIFMRKAKDKGYKTKGFSYEDIFSQIYTQEIEPNLGRRGYPTLIFDYPKEFAALAKLNEDGLTAQRFEFYIEGIELGDCYSELTDWKEQRDRFSQESNKRKILKKINHPVDKGFIEALKYGLPKCAGIAIGFERLAMIFADIISINQLKLINIDL